MDYKKRIETLEKQLNIRLSELNELKIELDFDGLIFKYKKLKKQIWKKENLIKITKDNSKIKFIYKDLNILNNEKQAILKELKKVTTKEKNIYILKGRIDGIIKYIDYKLNSLNLKIKKNDYYLQDLEKKIKPKYLNSLEKELISLEKKISSIKKDIELKISKKQMVIKEKIDLKFNYKRLFKIKLEIKKIKKDNLDISKERFKIISYKNDLLISNTKILQKNINNLLLLITKLNESLSFIDSDEISDNTSFSIKYLNAWYGNKQALFDINVNFPKNEVISIIGPSGCGKSTFLKTLNRINDNIPSFKSKGKILLDGEYDIYKLKSIRNRYDKIELSTLRTLVGMIFQQPNPFPMSIAKNVQYGPKVKGIKNKSLLEKITENSLKEAGLWDEVKENLKALGTSLSGGQQQRLCIARAIANEPEILLMDEPTSALDPIASKKIEELILKLKKNYTVIMVTHSMQQAQRISDKTAFFYEGKLIEFGDTKKLFNNPKEKETKAYVSGKFG